MRELARVWEEKMKIQLSKKQIADYLDWCSEGSGSLYQIDFILETREKISIFLPRVNLMNIAFENR